MTIFHITHSQNYKRVFFKKIRAETFKIYNGPIKVLYLILGKFLSSALTSKIEFFNRWNPAAIDNL